MAKRRQSELLQLIGALILPFAVLFANLVAATALASAGWWAAQRVTGHELRGSLTETHTETVRGRHPTTYCYGTLQPAEGTPPLRVRVVLPVDSCRNAPSRSLTVVPAAGAPFRRLLTRDYSSASSVDAVFGMVPMVLLDGRTLLLESWKLVLVGLIGIGWDVVLVGSVRRWWRRRSGKDARQVRTVTGGARVSDPPPPPPLVLYFGSTRESVPEILEWGLRRGDEAHVQLWSDAETARRIAAAAGRPVVFAVDAAALRQAGFSVGYAGGAWSVDHVPARFLDLQPIR